jgi:nucleotide-binding universal stress UspA family protein
MSGGDLRPPRLNDERRDVHTPTILVPLAESTEAADALPVAQALAKLTGATLHLLHVSTETVPVREIREKLQLSPEQLSGAVLDAGTGSFASVVTQEAKKAGSDLIVMTYQASTERESEEDFGEVPRHVLLDAPCPVVLVPAGHGRAWSLKRILVPHDGTPISTAPIGPASDLCRRAAAELTVLHVATPAAAPPLDLGAIPARHYLDQPQHEWPAWGQEFLDRARAIGKPVCDVKFRTVVCTEQIGRAVVRFAVEDHADLIVLAWRMSLDPGRARTMRFVVREAPCPALITPVRRERTG